ncbi:hypothetical protein VPH35_110094 [Triticum aestivum]
MSSRRARARREPPEGGCRARFCLKRRSRARAPPDSNVPARSEGLLDGWLASGTPSAKRRRRTTGRGEDEEWQGSRGPWRTAYAGIPAARRRARLVATSTTARVGDSSGAALCASSSRTTMSFPEGGTASTGATGSTPLRSRVVARASQRIWAAFAALPIAAAKDMAAGSAAAAARRVSARRMPEATGASAPVCEERLYAERWQAWSRAPHALKPCRQTLLRWTWLPRTVPLYYCHKKRVRTFRIDEPTGACYS